MTLTIANAEGRSGLRIAACGRKDQVSVRGTGAGGGRTESAHADRHSAAETGGDQALGKLADQLRRAADDGFASAWISNIFGLEALTSLAVAGSQVPGIELGTAVVPTYPRHPAVLAQQALTAALAVGPAG